MPLTKTYQIFQGEALNLYKICRRFTNTLAVMVWISVAWMAYEMYFKVTDQYNEHWKSDWITSDFWHILNFIFLAVLCFLFRPSPLSTRFSYTDTDGMFFLSLDIPLFFNLRSET